ncbi:hypothetical protein [Candidatus Symbiopectobacterium endolongispinus]|nr:hypothetical protein [Candidatus Symbiopectobacterium endolongispinus]
MYQAGRFANHPLYSASAIGAVLAVWAITLFFLSRNGNLRQQSAVVRAA